MGELYMQTEKLLIARVKKIAVLRALVLGDLIFSLPALDALHGTYPNAEILYLGRPWHAGFLPGRVAGIARVIPFNDSSGELNGDLGYLIDPSEEDTFFKKLRAEQVDLAVQLQGGGSASNTFIQWLEARVSVGAREPKAPALDRWIPYAFQQNEIMRCLEIAGLAGAVTHNLHPQLAVLPSDQEAAQPFLDQIEGPFVVIHPGARDIRRCWPPEKFARAADACKRRFGLTVVLTGSSVDDQLPALVEARMNEPAINLAGKLSLPALTGLLSQASLVLANDTGPLHLALAVGVKAVGLFWSEYLTKSLPLTRVGFLPVIAWQTHCPLCGRPALQDVVEGRASEGCAHETSFMTSITVSEVLRTIEEVMEEHPARMKPTSQRSTEIKSSFRESSY